MALQSDLSINVSKFKHGAASDETIKFNDYLMDTMKKGPKWFEVGAAKYREMRARGEAVFPPAVMLDRAKSISVPSRERGRDIPCRVLVPENGREAKAVYMYIHGGGFVLSSEKENDTVLAQIADAANVVVISVGYRLAPEHPFPKGPEDCSDAAEWLIDNAKEEFGVGLQFIGGESAGGHLALQTYIHLATSRPSVRLSGLILNYGVFDLSFLPHVHNFKKRDTLILDEELMEHYAQAFCPGMTLEQRRDPAVSPFYFDFGALVGKGEGEGEGLPPAMFTVGTEDCLLDDSVMMAAKWMMWGGEAAVKVFPGAPHGFTLFPAEKCPGAGEGVAANCAFIKMKTK